MEDWKGMATLYNAAYHPPPATSVIGQTTEAKAHNFIGILASLTRQNLNTLANTLSSMESLSAVIASIHAGLANTGHFGISPGNLASSQQRLRVLQIEHMRRDLDS
jgi:hypothetical protein